jgi:ferredoxin
MTLATTKMGLHEWAYKNDYNPVGRQKMQHVDLVKRFEELSLEVELGFSAEQTAREVERCLNCDVETVFSEKRCIECDACVDVCPVLCLTIAPNADEAALRKSLSAPAVNPKQALYASGALPQTGRVMLKDEDLCVHCGLCAERCPTFAWDMQKFDLLQPYAGKPCSTPR